MLYFQRCAKYAERCDLHVVDCKVIRSCSIDSYSFLTSDKMKHALILYLEKLPVVMAVSEHHPVS